MCAPLSSLMILLPPPVHVVWQVYHLVSGRLLADLLNLHSRPLSAILFFRPLKLLITAARDGTSEGDEHKHPSLLFLSVFPPSHSSSPSLPPSVKAWDSQWLLQGSFIGHQGPVSSLAPYPHGPFIISGSLDMSLRVWSLTAWDEVDR